jgi:hypothetical protein
MKKTAQDVTMDLLKDTSRTVDFTQMIRDQQEFVRKARSIAGSKPSKVETAYIEEQAAKLTQLQDIVRSWIWEAFKDDDEVVSKTMYWGEVQKNYNITVVVEKTK